MSISAESFWADDDYNNPLFSEEVLAQAEKSLGVRLPKEFISLLRIRNGGYTRGFVFPTSRPTSWAEDHVPLDELYGIGEPTYARGSLSIYDSKYMTEEWDLPPKQILLAGNGHWWITLDYRRGASPSVSWLDVEIGEELELANSFAEFLAGLLPSDAVDDETCLLKPR